MHYRIDNSTSSSNRKGQVFAIVQEYTEIANWLHSKGTKLKYEDYLYVAKLSAYLWNLDRLSIKQSLKFLNHMKKEFKNQPVSKYYSSEQKRLVKQIVMLPPAAYLALHDARKIYRKVRRK